MQKAKRLPQGHDSWWSPGSEQEAISGFLVFPFHGSSSLALS